MRLYTFWRSSAAYRVRIALALKGLAWETVATRFATQEHRQPASLAVNPQGLVPALEHDGRVLAQSVAIIEYVDERFPAPPLLPDEPWARATVRSMALAIACDIHPLNNLRVLGYLRDSLGVDEASVMRWYAHWIGEGFAGLERLAAQYSTRRRHLYCDSVTIADVALVPQMYNARRFNCDLAAYPTLLQIAAHLDSLPAFAAARPEVQPDAA